MQQSSGPPPAAARQTRSRVAGPLLTLTYDPVCAAEVFGEERVVNEGRLCFLDILFLYFFIIAAANLYKGLFTSVELTELDEAATGQHSVPGAAGRSEHFGGFLRSTLGHVLNMLSVALIKVAS